MYNPAVTNLERGRSCILDESATYRSMMFAVNCSCGARVCSVFYVPALAEARRGLNNSLSRRGVWPSFKPRGLPSMGTLPKHDERKKPACPPQGAAAWQQSVPTSRFQASSPGGLRAGERLYSLVGSRLYGEAIYRRVGIGCKGERHGACWLVCSASGNGQGTKDVSCHSARM